MKIPEGWLKAMMILLAVVQVVATEKASYAQPVTQENSTQQQKSDDGQEKSTDESPERVAEILAELKKFQSVDATDDWCELLRELVEIGPDAVPPICAELDATDDQLMMRRLGFALRAIGDPRAVPALIRAIPKTLQPPMSDYGLIVTDADLLAFMKQYDLDREKGKNFSFGRPVREVIGAIHQLSGHKLDDEALFLIHRNDDPRRQALQRQLFQKQAEKWQEWWEKNWNKFTDDERQARVNLPVGEEVSEPLSVTLTANSNIDDSFRGMVLSPPGEKGRQFIDLDTGLMPKWPAHIPEQDSAEIQSQLAQWAARTGVDIMCVTYRDAKGDETYALKVFNAWVWELTDTEAHRLKEFPGKRELPTQKPIGDLLLHFDEESQQFVPDQNASFVYITRQGGIGMIQVTDRISKLVDIADFIGRPASDGPPPGSFFFKGVRFDHATISP